MMLRRACWSGVSCFSDWLEIVESASFLDLARNVLGSWREASTRRGFPPVKIKAGARNCRCESVKVTFLGFSGVNKNPRTRKERVKVCLHTHTKVKGIKGKAYMNCDRGGSG